MRVIIDVDEAIEVAPERNKNLAEDPLMPEVKGKFEAKLAKLRSECRMYRQS